MTKKNEESELYDLYLSKKQKEVLMRARKSSKAYDLMQARKNGMHQDLADIIKKTKEDGDD